MIQAIFYITKTTIENKLFPEFLSYTRQQLFKLFLEKNKTDFNDASISSDITRILEVTRYMKDVFAWVCQYIIPVSILTIFINLYFVYKMPLLGAVNFISNTTIIKYILSSYQKLIDNSNKRETKYMEMVTTLDENFNNLLNIYLNNQVDETISKNKETEDEYISIYKEQNDEVLLFINKFKAINYMFTVISMILIYKMHTLDTKEFVNIILIFSFYMTLFENLSEDVPGYIMMIGNIRNAEPFLEGIYTTEPKHILDKYEGNIHFDNITFKYNKKNIFQDFYLCFGKFPRSSIMTTFDLLYDNFPPS
jgi:ABC-type multidrug transport system fused ATPase/permease subunit